MPDTTKPQQAVLDRLRAGAVLELRTTESRRTRQKTQRVTIEGAHCTVVTLNKLLAAGLIEVEWERPGVLYSRTTRYRLVEKKNA